MNTYSNRRCKMEDGISFAEDGPQSETAQTSVTHHSFVQAEGVQHIHCGDQYVLLSIQRVGLG